MPSFQEGTLALNNPMCQVIMQNSSMPFTITQPTGNEVRFYSTSTLVDAFLMTTSTKHVFPSYESLLKSGQLSFWDDQDEDVYES